LHTIESGARAGEEGVCLLDRAFRRKPIMRKWEYHFMNTAQRKDMDNSKPFEIIAARFQISRESAKYFLIRVQKSFKTEKPPHRLILEFIDGQNFESLPKPHRVAALMNENGIWVHPLSPEPPSLFEEEDIYGE
jgi:hypothetical protein